VEKSPTPRVAAPNIRPFTCYEIIAMHQSEMHPRSGGGFSLLYFAACQITVRCPDVGFIRRERAPQRLSQGYVPFAPDLAVEVVSPGNRAGEMHERVRDFLRFGTALVWEVHPTTQTVIVHTADDAHTIESDGILDGGAVLPGFSLPIAQCFND